MRESKMCSSITVFELGFNELSFNESHQIKFEHMLLSKLIDS